MRVSQGGPVDADDEPSGALVPKQVSCRNEYEFLVSRTDNRNAASAHLHGLCFKRKLRQANLTDSVTSRKFDACAWTGRHIRAKLSVGIIM